MTMPYPCSHFYFDIKSVAKIDIKVKVTTWIGQERVEKNDDTFRKLGNNTRG